MGTLRSLIDALRTHRPLGIGVWLVVSGAAAIAVSCGASEDDGDVAETPVSAAASAPADADSETQTEADVPAGSLEAGLAVYAGNGKGSFEGDGGPATEASMFGPSGLAVDANGNLYISTDNRVRKVDAATGVITTLAGTGSPGFGGDDRTATEARLKLPVGLAVDGDGNVFIADGDNGRIRRIDVATGIISTVAGGGIPKRVSGMIDPGDGGLATDAFFKAASDVAIDSEGNVYFAAENRIRRVDAGTGIITTLTGNGVNDLSGDGGPSTSAGVADPRGLALDDQGNLYFADTGNQRVRRIDGATGIITTVAGIGKHAPPGTHRSQPTIGPEGQGFSGDGGPGTAAMLSIPNDTVIGPDGNLYIADTGNDRIRKVDLTTGVITTFADGGAVRGEKMETGFQEGGDIKITFTNFAPPVAIAVTRDGVFFIADSDQNKVMKLAR